MKLENQVRLRNKKATFLYEIVETFTAGIQLLGTEIKSLRLGQASLTESYCSFIGEELFIKNMNINEYQLRGYVNHEPRRDRKLLLNRRELDKLAKKTKEKGFTIVTLSLFTTAKGLVKVDIALARGKRQFDKRQDIKQKDSKRELDRLSKNN